MAAVIRLRKKKSMDSGRRPHQGPGQDSPIYPPSSMNCVLEGAPFSMGNWILYSMMEIKGQLKLSWGYTTHPFGYQKQKYENSTIDKAVGK